MDDRGAARSPRLLGPVRRGAARAVGDERFRERGIRCRHPQRGRPVGWRRILGPAGREGALAAAERCDEAVARVPDKLGLGHHRRWAPPEAGPLGPSRRAHRADPTGLGDRLS